MKKKSILIIACILGACSSKVSHEKAVEFSENMVEANRLSKIDGQTFIDEATAIMSNLTENPNCEIDFEKTNKLLEKAVIGTENSLSNVAKIDEIDKEVNYKSNFEIYKNAEKEVLSEFKSFFKTLQKTRELDTIEEIKDKLYKKLSVMKEKEILLNEAWASFNQKYEL